MSLIVCLSIVYIIVLGRWTLDVIWKYRIPISNKLIGCNTKSSCSIRLWRQRVQSGSIYLKIHFFLARLAKTVSGIYLLHIDSIYKILSLDTQYALIWLLYNFDLLVSFRGHFEVIWGKVDVVSRIWIFYMDSIYKILWLDTPYAIL